jgi:hypothetical protein
VQLLEVPYRGTKLTVEAREQECKKANPPAEKTTPDAKPPALFATLFGTYFPRRSSCFVTQLLAMLAMEYLRIAVMSPSAHNGDAQSLSMKSSSASIALPQH